MPQNYAKACGVTEILPLAELLEDALQFATTLSCRPFWWTGTRSCKSW